MSAIMGRQQTSPIPLDFHEANGTLKVMSDTRDDRIQDLLQARKLVRKAMSGWVEEGLDKKAQDAELALNKLMAAVLREE